MRDEDIKTFTYKQLNNIYQYVDGIIDSLPDKALSELVAGYDNDLNALLEEITFQVHNVVNNNASQINSESFSYAREVEYAIDKQLKKYSLNYFYPA